MRAAELDRRVVLHQRSAPDRGSNPHLQVLSLPDLAREPDSALVRGQSDGQTRHSAPSVVPQGGSRSGRSHLPPAWPHRVVGVVAAQRGPGCFLSCSGSRGLPPRGVAPTVQSAWQSGRARPPCGYPPRVELPHVPAPLLESSRERPLASLEPAPLRVKELALDRGFTEAALDQLLREQGDEHEG